MPKSPVGPAAAALPHPSPSSAEPEAGRLSGPQRRALAATLLAVALATLDTTLVNTALPGIAASLQADPASTIWVINAYQLAVVVTLLPFAALGDRWGPRPVYLCWPTACTAWPPRELCKAWAPELPAQDANRVLAVVAGQGHEVGEDLGPITER